MEQAYKNTDRELWRQNLNDPLDPDNYYAPSVHVTIDGKIGIKSGWCVVQAMPEEWVRLACTAAHPANKALHVTPNRCFLQRLWAGIISIGKCVLGQTRRT